MPKQPKPITALSDLTPDPQNARKHNPRNIGQVQNSLQKYGAARSIVIDENGQIIAGHGVVEAAALAGIERVQVVDGDGETIIAVRRSGLTKKQKQELGVADNRGAELAEWDAGVLAELAGEIDLSQFWRDDELAAVLAQQPSADEWGAGMDGLPNEDRAPFQQMTFTLHDTQAEQVKAALSAAQRLGAFTDSPNANSNGNALARICETFLTEHAHG
jgi:ParB family transcriptional regulator, chromosome partitioning protein